MTDEDGELVAGFLASGRIADFERLVQRHRQNVFRVALAVLGPGRASHAEDVAQEVFIDMYGKLASFEGRSRFSTWLYRVAYNRALDYRRKHKLDVDGEPPLAVEPAAESPLDDSLQSRALSECVARLPNPQRAALHLHYWLGHSVDEIAAILGVRSGTVKAWLSRARYAIARGLRKKGACS